MTTPTKTKTTLLTYTYTYAHHPPDSKSGIIAEKRRLSPKKGGDIALGLWDLYSSSRSWPLHPPSTGPFRLP
eukprot:8341686-Pyramimonas_sp.AAC.1